ncbi:MAG: UvrD-helicase domain-containing protein [Verrucomicrobiales bacterium]|nr:UvrD-helicase domain-containing protein [Verrucomicrobiales bacterium]
MVNLATLNPQQRQAVETTEGPVLILAGAGTGKTRVITTRIAHLIERGVPPDRILGVTFTNKAAREMLQRVNQLLPRRRRGAAEGPAPRPTLCTFHSLCVRILRRHIERLGYKANFVIYDESEQLGVVKKLLSRIASKDAQPDAPAVLGMLSRMRNAGSEPPTFADPKVAAIAQHLRQGYESALRACNAVDFDDLILLVLRLLREHPEVLEECRQRYRYVMVDEYQDTNAAQFELVHTLTREHRNLCVVGDDDQSIYGWRGAEIANLLELERFFPEVKVVKLEQNYRSTTLILNAANALIRNNARRRPKQLWSQNGAGTPILLHTFENDEQEAQAVVNRIEADRFARRVPWSEQAVLFRTNGQSRPIEAALRKAKVRYHLVGGQSFFDRREVRDLLAFLKTLVNPRDDISLLRIANVPARGLSDTTMQRLLAASQERHGPVFEAMQNPVVQTSFPGRTRTSIEEFVALIEENQNTLSHTRAALAEPKLSEWTRAFLDGIGYFTELRRSEKDPEAAENRVRNLVDLLASMDAVETEANDTRRDQVIRFLEEVTLDNDRNDDTEQRRDAVTLITMHSCKGLEFPHVFIVGIEEGLLPHARSKLEGTLDEERRLFYVAITRAMRTLQMSWCVARRKYGQLTAGHPSQFLKELPEDLVTRAESRPREAVSLEQGRNFFASIRAVTGAE